MACRRNLTFDVLIEIVSKLPWWVGCLLAVVTYLVLHFVANIELKTPEGSNQLGLYAGKQLYLTLARFGQYILPVVFLFGALLSFISKRKQQQRYDSVSSQNSTNGLFEMTWLEFEGLVTESFRRKGYAVKQTGGNGPDGGVDIVLTKGNDKYLVQCKQWKAYKVGVQIVRELHGVMAASGAAGGFVVTAGEFTKDAKKFVEGLNVTLLNGEQLHRMIREVKAEVKPEIEPSTAKVQRVKPVCPNCGSVMMLRTATKGKYPAVS